MHDVSIYIDYISLAITYKSVCVFACVRERGEGEGERESSKGDSLCSTKLNMTCFWLPKVKPYALLHVLMVPRVINDH